MKYYDDRFDCLKEETYNRVKECENDKNYVYIPGYECTTKATAGAYYKCKDKGFDYYWHDGTCKVKPEEEKVR